MAIIQIDTNTAKITAYTVNLYDDGTVWISNVQGRIDRTDGTLGEFGSHLDAAQVPAGTQAETNLKNFAAQILTRLKQKMRWQ